MADDYKVSNQLPAAAAAAASSSSLPVSKDKEEASHPLPAMHDVVVKQIKVQRPLLPADNELMDDVKTPPAAASPVAVLPADNDDKTPPPPPVADRVLLLLTVVSLWAIGHAFDFAVDILIADGAIPCTELRWLPLLPPCVALTDAAAAQVSALLHAQLWCVTAAGALAVPLRELLTAKSCIIRGGRWATAAVDAMAWLALAATAGIHCVQLASDRIYLAADHGERYFFLVNVLIVSFYLTVDVVLAGFLLCCRLFPRRQGLGEH